MIERQIGEKFDYDGVRLEVVESGPCKGCHFFVNGANIYCKGFNGEINGPCIGRSDGKSVKFQKVE